MGTTGPTPQEIYAQLYDLAVADWPGEIEFYRELAQADGTAPVHLLEVACGTGRVSLQLAGTAAQVTGFDLSPELLEIARKKSAGMDNVRWEAGDMRSFELGRRFELIIIPGHSFQFMLTPEDQLACLACIKRHLVPQGRLAVHLDHQDVGWLAGLPRQAAGTFSRWRELEHPATGRTIRTSNEWAYDPATQTASVSTVWEEAGEGGDPVRRWQRAPMSLHCVFRFEMEHLLARAGFTVEAVYGDFFKNGLSSDSEEMVWIARSQ